VLPGYGSSVYSATYSPDGKRIVTASEDKMVRVWNMSPEPQRADQIAKLIRCQVGARFESDDSNIIVPAIPNPSECQLNP
jgi:WD40 repeat protein